MNAARLRLFRVAGLTVALATTSAVAQDRATRGTACWIKVSAREDGSFTVTNTRNAFAKTYAAP